MKYHLLPNTDLEVSALCLGAGGFGTSLRGEALDRLIAAFLEAGGNFFDTAHCYAFWEESGLGASERELGASLRRLGAQDRAIVATKGGHPDFGEKYRRPDDFLAEAVIASDIEESLNRLEIDCIDLYYLHRDDGRTPVAEIMGRLNREIERGRVRWIGASNWPVRRIAEANVYAAREGLQGFVASQVQGSLVAPNWKPTEDPTPRSVTNEEIEWHSASGVPLVVYSATAGGYFARSDRLSDLYDSPANRARRERAIELSARLRCTPTQIALAYLLHLTPTVIPLFSTTRLDHLAEALGSLHVALTPEQTEWLRGETPDV